VGNFERLPLKHIWIRKGGDAQAMTAVMRQDDSLLVNARCKPKYLSALRVGGGECDSPGGRKMDGEKGFYQDVTRRAFIFRTALMTLVTFGGLGSAAREICWGQSGSSNKAKLREKYRGLSRQELLDKTYTQGAAYVSISGSCSQSTAAALHEFLEIDDAVVLVANSSCGGQAVTGLGTCGGIIGGTMVLDYFLGRPVEAMSSEPSKKPDRERHFNAIQTAKLLCDRFAQEYGSILCSAIQMKLFGRTYYLLDPDDVQKFLKAGALSDPTKTRRVVGNAAKWTMEILLDKGVVEL